jgi:uncharacterized Zn-binding protein involved in type VI secretion
MPLASTHPATTTGHDGYHPTVSTEGSGDVFIEGDPALHGGGLAFIVHVKPGNNPSPHVETTEEGSSTVFINGSPACRIGDDLSMGDTLASANATVFIGG